MTAGRGSEDPWNYCGFDLKNGTYLSDQVSTMVALDHLRELGAEYKSSGKPFFVGLGFHKPVSFGGRRLHGGVLRCFSCSPPLAWPR